MAAGLQKLSAVEVRAALKNGAAVKLSDGGGLTLRISGPGVGKWLVRYMQAGRARELGLGSASSVSLADARAAALEARRILAKGEDPISARQAAGAAKREAAAQASVRTFEAVAVEHIKAQAPGWKRPLHATQWLQSLKRHAFPILGKMDVANIGRDHVLRVVKPLWETKPEVASRLRMRIEAVLSAAEARDLREGPNPAVWRGGLKALLPEKSRVARTRHQPALPWLQVPAFMGALRTQPGCAALALRLTILTALRTSEVIGARWEELDEAAGTWTIPKARMKGRARRDHRVPISEGVREVLAEARTAALEGNPYIFPGSRADKPLSNMAMLMLMRRMHGDKPRWRDDEGRPVVPHGFRSSFRDWAAEQTNHPRELAETCLAHFVGNSVERAYARSDLLDKRRTLMQQWSKFVTGTVGGAEE